jgi:hypothetical protein
MPSLRCAWKEFRGESILQDVCDVIDRSAVKMLRVRMAEVCGR